MSWEPPATLEAEVFAMSGPEGRRRTVRLVVPEEFQWLQKSNVVRTMQICVGKEKVDPPMYEVGDATVASSGDCCD